MKLQPSYVTVCQACLPGVKICSRCQGRSSREVVISIPKVIPGTHQPLLQFFKYDHFGIT